MKISLFLVCAFCILDRMLVEAYPRTYDPFPNQHQNCIKMTSEATKEINVMVDEITDFLNDIAVKHENFDVRLVIINIEQHSDDEPEEKNTILQLNVNDCPKEIVTKYKQNSKNLNQYNQDVDIDENQNDGSEMTNDVESDDEEFEEISDETLAPDNDSAADLELDTNESDEVANEKSNNDDEIQTDNEKDDEEIETDVSDDNNEERVTSKPEFMFLDLPAEVQEIVDKIEKKKGKVTPLIVYVQGDKGENQNYVFLNTK